MIRQSRTYSTIITYVILAALAAWICVTGLLVYWVGDDVDYMFIINDSIWDSHGSINNVVDLFTSMHFHYINVNGRYVAHLLVQLFCGICGQTAFAIVNALIWPLFIVLIARCAGVDWKQPIVISGVVVLALLSFVTKMMPTCQIGFIWMMALTMLWLLTLRRYRERHLNPWLLIPLFLFSVIAGNGQEALNIGIAVALGIECLRRRFRLSAVEWIMTGGFVIGLAILCFTPAMFNRLGGVTVTWTQSLLNLVFCLRIFWILCAVIVWKVSRKEISLKKIWRDNRFWFIAMAALFAMNIAIKVYCNRQLFGIELCALIILLRTLRNGTLSKFWLTVFATLTLLMMAMQTVWILDSRAQFKEMEALYTASEKGNVFYNRRRSSASPMALTARYHETAVGNDDADITHSFAKYLREKYPHKKYPHFFPEKLQTSTFPDAINTVEEYYPGHYVVITDTVQSHTVTLHREWNLPFVHIKASDKRLESPRNHTKKSRYRTYVIVPEDPYLRTVAITLDQ